MKFIKVFYTKINKKKQIIISILFNNISKIIIAIIFIYFIYINKLK